VTFQIQCVLNTFVNALISEVKYLEHKVKYLYCTLLYNYKEWHFCLYACFWTTSQFIIILVLICLCVSFVFYMLVWPSQYQVVSLFWGTLLLLFFSYLPISFFLICISLYVFYSLFISIFYYENCPCNIEDYLDYLVDK
jgi:hypothetical protein